MTHKGLPAGVRRAMVKLVVAEGQMAELEIYRMTELFDHFAELEEAVRALRAT